MASTSSRSNRAQRITGTVVESRRVPVREGTLVIGQVEPDAGGDPVPFVGQDLPGCEVGSTVILEGHWERHARYGRQFRVSGAQGSLPVEETTVIEYITHNVKHCGEARARTIVRSLGTDCLGRLAEDPALVRQVFPGKLGERLEREWSVWAEHYRRDEDACRLIIQLMEAGIPHFLSRRVQQFALGGGFEQLGEEPLRNPYALTFVPGIGFPTADKIAQRQGLVPQDPSRIEAGIFHVLEYASGSGSSALPRPLLLRRAGEALGPVPKSPIRDSLKRLLEERRLTEDHGLVFFPAVARKEERVAHLVRKLASRKRELSLEESAIVEEAVASEGLSSHQARAVQRALHAGLFALTGRPGSGKTTAMRTLVRLAERLGWKLELVAPTGKAASRATELTGISARTVHRLLGGSVGNRTNGSVDADIVVLDEASMVDLPVMEWLLSNLNIRTTSLVLVGDPHQLPSVGHGRVLADVIESGVVEHEELTEVFRQQQGSRIIENAHRLLDGRSLLLDNNSASDFWYANISKDAEVVGDDGFPAIVPNQPKKEHREGVRLLKRAVDHLVRERGANPARDIQVLTPMRKGALGMHTLNQALQDAFNPNGASGPKIGGGSVVRTGDRVIQTRNDYDVEEGLFNGEQGVVEEVTQRSVLVRFDGRRLRLSGPQLGSLNLGWALTVHRAQGSEFPYVILLYHSSHQAMLDASILYTAITRARDKFILIGNERALQMTRWKGNASLKRHTALKHRLARSESGEARTMGDRDGAAHVA